MQYSPRAAFLPFHQRTQRWAIVAAHRRAGKTVACVADLITAAMSCKKPSPQYAYVAPYRAQAKSVAWKYLQEMARPFIRDPENDVRQSDLSVKLFNGATIRLFGGDNPSSLRGLYLDGLVLDEVADLKQELWAEVLRPALADRKGWATFIGSVKGKNFFYDLWQEAQGDPNWFSLMLKASEAPPGVFPPGELEDARRTMPEAAYEAEFECNWMAAVPGAIYAKELDKFASQVTSVPYNGAHLVHCAWDLGVSDYTSIFFWQHVGQEVRIIDYYESSGERLTHYLSHLAAKPYSYDTMWLPHDADHRQLTGLSAAEVVREAGFKVRVLPRLGLNEGIDAARTLIPRCWFDKVKTEVGMNALRHYRWDWNDRMGLLKSTPVHDENSHAADAFRYLALAAKDSDRKMSSNGGIGFRTPLKQKSRQPDGRSFTSRLK